MVDIIELILDGLLCQVCGGAMDDINDYCIGGRYGNGYPGYPRTCADCKEAADAKDN